MADHSKYGSIFSLVGRRMGLVNDNSNRIQVGGFVVAPPLYLATTPVGNGSDTSSDVMQTYSLPRNYLANTGQGIYVRAYGKFGAGNTNVKRAYLTIGGVTIATGTSSDTAGLNWAIETKYIKTGSNTQRAISNAVVGTTFLALNDTTDTAVDTSAITIAVKGLNTAASGSDVICDILQVSYL